MKPIDCTPLSDDEIHVWRFPLIAARQEITSIGRWLSEKETKALGRMVSDVQRNRRTVAWGRLRFILSRYLGCAPHEIQIERARIMRPRVVHPNHKELQFNLSHSGSFGLIGISRVAVGVDIEKVNTSARIEELATRFFSYEVLRQNLRTLLVDLFGS